MENNQLQPMTMLYMSPEDFTTYLYKAMEKGKELEYQRSIEEDFLTREQVMEMLHIKSAFVIAKMVKNKEFAEYGERPKLYKKSEILSYIQRTKNN